MMTALDSVFICFCMFILSLIQVDSRFSLVSRSCSYPVRSVATQLLRVAPNAMRCETPVPRDKKRGNRSTVGSLFLERL